jgi:3',5'-cyclic AMP phosphodiesterase CpdA
MSARSRALRRAVPLCLVGALAVILWSCAGFRYNTPADLGLALPETAAWPAARFAVFSDAHLYDTALGTYGAAFQRDMDNDRKLLPESKEILSEAIRQVSGMGVQFLLIPGDLTKDGERQNHLLMAEQLSALARQSVRVFVVPGNHDIQNPHAVRYDGRSTRRVPNITPSEFAEIYKDAGYGDALFRDPDSLSYVAEPVPGLWLLAVDSTDYQDNRTRTTPATGSGLTPTRVAWIGKMLGQAVVRRKAVIAMMHHGVVEHFAGQYKYFPQYLLSDWQGVADMLASYGVRVVFTGHFHAQDIAVRGTGQRAIYDVETGSLVTFPDPLRLVTIDADSQKMRITSSFIKDLPSFSERGVSFWEYSREFMHTGTARIAARALASLGISGAEASMVADQIADAFAAHFQGDEHFTGSEILSTRGLGLFAAAVVNARRDLVTSLWQDTGPPDNNVVINLAAGTWENGD